MTGKKTVYISPQKASEIIPLLGEALLLYDAVALDVSLGSVFDVLAANLEIETMEYLIGKNILHLVIDEKIPVQIQQTDKILSTIVYIQMPKKDNELPIDIEKFEKSLVSVYPKSLIESIYNSIKSTNINVDNVLSSCYRDFANKMYIDEIFEFVKDSFNLPNFDVEVQGSGVLFQPKTNNRKEAKRVIEEATYGLHLIAQVNHRMALLASFDEVACENEYENFFASKLYYNFRRYNYKDNVKNFFELCEIHNFPDVKELIGAGLLSIKDILKLRKGDGQILRSWLDSVTNKSNKEGIEFSKQCAKIFSTVNTGLPLPARTVVFGLLQGLSLSKPYPAMALSAVNEFILPKLIDEWRPRWFFDKARKLYINKTA